MTAHISRFMESTQKAEKPRMLSNNYLSWLRPAWNTSEEEIIRVGGFDAAMYIKILSFGEMLDFVNRREIS